MILLDGLYTMGAYVLVLYDWGGRGEFLERGGLKSSIFVVDFCCGIGILLLLYM